eukprot:Opistho-2@21516
MHREAAAIQMCLTGSLCVARDNNDGAVGVVFGKQARSASRCGEQNDSGGVAVVGSLHCGARNRLWHGHGARHNRLDFVEHGALELCAFCLATDLVHHLNGFNRVCSLCSLAREHDAVSAIKNGVRHIEDLSTRWPWIVCHALEHLRRTNDGLAGNIALRNQHFLRQKDLLGRNLNAKVTACNHHAVDLLENLGEIAHALVVLDLCNYLNVLALFAKTPPHLDDVAGLADKRRKDHVHAALNAELEVETVLLRKRGEIDRDLGKIHSLSRPEHSGIEHRPMHIVVALFDHLDRDEAVVDENKAPNVNHLRQALVVHIEHLRIANLGKGLVR